MTPLHAVPDLPAAAARLCEVVDCGKKHKAHGFCCAHVARLRRYGIAPVADTDDARDDVREILYNTRADAVAIAQDAGRPVFIDFPGFRCAPVMPDVYGHVVDGRAAALDVLNLRDTPLRGAFRITGAISSASPQAPARLALPAGEAAATVLPCEKIWTWQTTPLLLPAGTTRVDLAVDDPAMEKLLVLDVDFLER